MVYQAQESMAVAGTDFIMVRADNLKEVIGVFKDEADLQSAIRELEGASFPRHAISVLGPRGEVEKLFGSKTIPPEMAINVTDTPREAPSRPEEQTIGTAGLIGGCAYIGAMGLALLTGGTSLPFILSAAATGAVGGGAAGVIVSGVLGGRYTRHIEEQIEEGGLPLWVSTGDMYQEEIAKHILVVNNAYNVHARFVE
ncbi:MAG: hypothetical protein WC989_02980 [Micavibrio sp.]